MKWYVLFKQTISYHFKFFKGGLPQISLGAFFNVSYITLIDYFPVEVCGNWYDFIKSFTIFIKSLEVPKNIQLTFTKEVNRLVCIWTDTCLNPFMHNVPKWSDTLSKSCSRIFKVSENFGTLCTKGLNGFTEAYSEPCQTSKMEVFVKTFNSLKPLNIFSKTLHLWRLTGLQIRLWSHIPINQTYGEQDF